MQQPPGVTMPRRGLQQNGKTDAKGISVSAARSNPANKLIAAIRKRLHAALPDVKDAELDSCVDRVLFYARQARQSKDVEVTPDVVRDG